MQIEENRRTETAVIVFTEFIFQIFVIFMRKQSIQAAGE